MRSLLPVTLLLAAMGLLAAGAPAAEPVNPYPRQVLSTEEVAEWTFDAGPDGWSALHHCRAEAAGGNLKIISTGDDPYLAGPAVRGEGPVAAVLRMKSSAGGGGQIFWATEQHPNFAEEHSARFAIEHDGQWHEYRAALASGETITRLRLDPAAAPGEILIDRIGLERIRLHPLELLAVEQSGGKLHLDLRNHSDAAIDFAAGAQRNVQPGRSTIEARKDRRVSFLDAALAPFEPVTVAVEPHGLPPIRRTVFLFRPDAERAWLTIKTDGLTVKAAPDGSGARLEAGGALVAALCPLVHRGGTLPRLRVSAQAGGLVFEGDGVHVTLAAQRDEVSVSITSAEPVEGPVLRAQGGLEGGLFAGLEYLGRGERSSSDLDIETAERLRYAPDPMKVTMPLMACATERGLAALTWTDMALQPVFAAPNFFDGQADHRMALRGTKIEAVILVRPSEPRPSGSGAVKPTVEDAILWAVRRRGLPPPPPPPRDPAAQDKLCLAAITGPCAGPAGWGHCAEASWQRHPYADIASTLWRLTGQAPAGLEKLVPGGGHVRNDAIYFVTGRAAEWLRVRAGQVQGILREQKEDGSFRYSGKYQRGHYEDTSSGHCARSAAVLLDYAHLTGDDAARDAGLKTLEYMKRFSVPRGAQTWELSLHTPDVLASAHLVWAYVRGYQLTGKDEYLAHARRWALTGLPFVYQWASRPVMLYATIPVYGATNWRAPNWMGLPVQWCGGVYAYALVMLAAYDKALDWSEVARGILISAQQQQAPDGPMAGCLPDSLALEAQRRQGPFINPSAIVSLQRALDGQADSLAVAADGKHRVCSPFPVTIKDGKAVIQARAGAAYQVLIDGKRIVDVKSAGTDTVPME